MGAFIAHLMAIIASLPLVVIANGANSWLHEDGTCYRQYIPSSPGFPRARCRYSLGGSTPDQRRFIPSAEVCCRRRMANGWGSKTNCQPCSAIRGVMTPWGNWSPCSRTCSRGIQNRQRKCSNDVCASRRKTETRSCLQKVCCPVDGKWSEWSPWKGCSATCGRGLRYRTRECSSPKPSCGGKRCWGFPRELQRCSIGPCASWSSWATVSSCSVSCGVGNRQRIRSCFSPLGDNCSGESVDYLSCDAGSCAVHGGWCKWSHWSPCTSSCQQTPGTRKRNRWCECPVPRNGGRSCSGDDGDVQSCSAKAFCPVDGGWSDWSSWSQCSSEPCSMSAGVRTRTRKCSSPPPQYGGSCKSQDEETRPCLNLDGCDIEGVYEEWSLWEPCTTTCGSCGIKIRKRTCSHSIDALKDMDVVGDANFYCDDFKLTENRSCIFGACPDGSNPCVSSSFQNTSPHSVIEEDDHPSEENSSLLYVDENAYESEYYSYDGSAEDVIDEPIEDTIARLEPISAALIGSGDTINTDLHAKSDNNDISDLANTFGLFESMMNGDFHELDDDMQRNFGIENSKDGASDEDIRPSESGKVGASDEYITPKEGERDGASDEDTTPKKRGCVGNVFYGTEEDDTERAVGCCEILSSLLWETNSGPQETDNVAFDQAYNDTEDTIDTDGSNLADDDRIEECFALHFKYVIDADPPDDLNDPFGRTVHRGSCRYRGKGRHLNTICCLRKSCSAWPSRLRNQCLACRKERACPSCSRILLSG